MYMFQKSGIPYFLEGTPILHETANRKEWQVHLLKFKELSQVSGIHSCIALVLPCLYQLLSVYCFFFIS